MALVASCPWKNAQRRHTSYNKQLPAPFAALTSTSTASPDGSARAGNLERYQALPRRRKHTGLTVKDGSLISLQLEAAESSRLLRARAPTPSVGQAKLALPNR